MSDVTNRERRVLVTGGAGFIGSHSCIDLLQHGHELIVVDNLVNASAVALDRVAELAGRSVSFREVDLRNRAGLDEVFREFNVDSVIHFAGLKAVGESVSKPLSYYDNNIGGTITLLESMQAHGVRSLVFSSSCSIHGHVDDEPITEDCPAAPTNPYSRTKWMIEEILGDLCSAEPEWSAVSLRYFNPIGAHRSGRLGEDPSGIPNNLMPYVMQVAVGNLEQVQVFGDDYPTPDGTGVRDYIHVMDLAAGHRLALDHIDERAGHRVYDLGTGTGTSVLELIVAAGEASGREIPYEIVARRAGDVASLVADPTLAREELGWVADQTIEAMCEDSWRWQSTNPTGL
jgi:UDP-glucose 4-epimerase